ncbi:hypothetical protein [Trichormus sp. NMC-1]|uniref:hypothetical protein n=1 Tax=Trichormus sp. NMC-1 TaxID=1853259 RepID=UPI0008DBF6CD|nr:hypothetical protein [Trichormus sp. NMC-1]
MTLEFKHFDTRLNQWIHTDGNTKNANSILTENLDNTLLGFFLPEKNFSFGQMDENTTAANLKNHPNGDVLLLSSKTRLLYGSVECLEVIEKLCPDRKDRGAYGSIFLGSCKNAIHEKLNILVVDDTNGENGGILPNDVAYKFVGDCYGQITTKLYDQITNRNEQKDKSYRVVQHRFGWREHDGEDTKYRFGKGTLRPYNLDEIKYANSNNKPKIDLIIPISSFKGTDKDNPSTPIKPQIKPGLYNQTIWLGEKSQSQKGKTAISQLLASFPQGIKDFAEELEKQAQELAEIQQDPRKVAQLYCEKYEKRKAFIEQQKTEQLVNKAVELSTDDPKIDENLYTDDLQEDSESEQDDLLMYKIIKADLLGHNQLLETEKVKQELTRFVQNEWRDIALGRVLTFDRGMIIPSKELKNGEISVPWIAEGEKILNFRSPFLNANGLCVSINKHIEDYLGPDGKPLAGIIVVNDEDHKRIQARIESLKAQGIETEELDPIETESERQGRDFDGDCIGVELASKYPNLTAEAEYRNLPENAYAPTVKLKKQSFYREDGTQPEFEEIAIHMSDGISVGIINNHVTALEALESEIETLTTYGNSQQQTEYLDQVSSHYKKLVNLENNQNHPQAIREEYREQMQEFLQLASVQDRNSQVIEQAMAINRNIYRQMIEAACFQNQIAVDLFKSAKKPDMEVIAENKRYLYRDVNYIKDKKSSSAYLKEGINTTGYSPVDLLINQVNKYFEASHLESRPIIQFQDLFKGVEFTPQQKFQAILAKQEFDDKFNVATRLNKRRETEQGPYAVVKTSNGTEITITNLTRYEHPGIWKGSTLNIRLEEIPEKYRSLQRPHTLLAIAQIDGETENGEPKYCKLGTVSQQSVIDYKLKPGMITQGATLVELKPELRESQIKLLFQEAYAVAENFYNLIPEDQKLPAAAATWNISASRQDELEQGDNSSLNSRKKVSNFVFATFGKEIISRLDELQFSQPKVLGIGKEGDNFVDREWNPQEKYSIEIQASRYPPGHERHNSRLIFVKDDDEEYKEFAVLEQRTGQLPIGTQAQAYIKPGESYTATATINLPSQPPINITIREISKFSHAGKTFNGEPVTLTIGNVPVPIDTAKIKLADKTLGELDADSIQELRKINYLANGNPLQLKLKSIGDSQHEGGFIIAESPHGNLLKINKINVYDFKGQVFTGEEYKSVSLEVPTSKNRDAVFLYGELLGVLHYKKDKEALQSLGLLKHGQEGSVNCILQSNFSHTFINIDTSTVEYPQIWTKESQAFQDNSQLNTVTQQEVMVEKSGLLLEKIKERPTILFTSQEDKVLGLIGIAVDNHKTELVQNWFKSKNIEFNVLPPQDVPLETKKGLSVIYLVSSTISSDDFDALKAKFGEPLSADGKNSAYNEYLNSLPNRPHIIGEKLDKVQELVTTTIPVIVTPNLSNNNPPQQTIPQPRDSVQEIITSPKSSNPLANLQPLNAAVATHMQKDVAMAEVATQFIGISSAPPETPSSTRNYQQAWGERANTGVYSGNDTIMVSGSGPWRGVTQQQILETFNKHYVPLIDQAIASKSSFVVGNAAGTDQLVKQYLETQGYKLEAVNDGYTRAVKLEQDTTLTNQQPQSASEVSSPVPTQPSSVMSSHGLKLPNSTPISSSNIVQKEIVADRTIQDQETTLEKLRTWYLTAQNLGKSAEYIQRIIEVGNEFKSGVELREKAVVAMNNDFQELHSINRLTQITQRMGDVFGIHQENGEVIVQGKEYLISINNSHKDLTIIKKDGSVLLDIKLGQINQSQVSAEVIDVFEEINNNINQSLASVKNQYLQV